MISAKRAHFHVVASTHPGMKGKNNEDRYAVSAYMVNAREQVPSLMAIVSDGIGGHRAGEIASEMTVEIISKAIAESDASQPEATLQDAIIAASEAIRKQASTDPAQKGMGATCACVWIIGDRLYTATVGDSRIYLIRNGSMRRLSTDHTWVQEAIDHGAITPEQGRRHPNAHVIRRYLGSQQPVIPDLRLRLSPDETDSQSQGNQGFQLMVGDHLIMCTDGLTDLVDDQEILSTISTMKQQQALDHLVSLANERGGHDNITVIDLFYPQVTADHLTAISQSGKTVPVVVTQEALPVGVTQSIKKEVVEVRKSSSDKRKLVLLSCLGMISVFVIFGGLFLAYRELTKPPADTVTPFITVTSTPTVTPSQIPQSSPTPSQPTRAVVVSTSPPPLPATPTYTPTYTPLPTSTLTSTSIPLVIVTPTITGKP